MLLYTTQKPRLQVPAVIDLETRSGNVARQIFYLYILHASTQCVCIQFLFIIFHTGKYIAKECESIRNRHHARAREVHGGAPCKLIQQARIF